MKDVWQQNIMHELGYWRSMVDGTFHNMEWVNGFRKRVTGVDIFPGHLRKYIREGSRILDVGSGPATVLGKTVQGVELNITAVDPLADQYNQLLEESGAKPAVKIIYGEAENLCFPANHYDFVYSRNALDHSYDPILAIQEMIRVCAPGGFVVIENVINEGLNEKYKGLHQWNFMPADNDLVIWTSDGKGKLLSKNVSGYAQIAILSPREEWVMVEFGV